MSSTDRRIRVLLLCASGELGGAERVLLDLLHAIKDVQFGLIGFEAGPLVERARHAGCDTSVIPLPGNVRSIGDSGGGITGVVLSMARAGWATPGLIRWRREMNRAIVAFGPDVIHSNSIKTHLASSVLNHSGAALLWHVHDFVGARRVAGGLLRRLRRRVRCIAAVSGAVASDVRSLLPGIPVLQIHNGVDTEQFQPGAIDGSWMDEQNAAGRVRVGLVATYAQWKGQEVFIDAVARLPAAVRDEAQFYIVGGPIYGTERSQWTEDELRERARAAGVGGVIRFIQFQPEPARVMRSLDVVVHASTAPEPFGRTIIEAMACGKAVIVSQGGGAAELFVPEMHALGVRPGSADELAAAISRLVADAELRQRLGAAAVAHVRRNFGLERFGKEFLELYQGLADGPAEIEST